MEYINEKLEEFNNYVKNKRVAILGLGVSNLPLLDYFYDLDCEIVVFDEKEKEKIEEAHLKKLNELKIDYHFGKNCYDSLVGFDIIFRSPSFLPTRKELEDEYQRGAIITSEVELVLELTPSFVIGITGSDGKTTTTTLISEILKEDGKKVFLGGNIGTPLFTEIKNMRPEDYVVLELSSFQLMNMKVSPDVSIITNITPNHLNIHKNMDEYVNAKKNIFLNQTSDNVVILNNENEITKACSEEVPGKVIMFSSKEKLLNGFIYDQDDEKIKICENGLRKHLIDTKQMKLRGVHNFENACCAIAATYNIVSIESIQKVLTEFKGVEHRLELVKETEYRIKWYNDSVSSSPTRTISGLNAFNTKNIVLIAGGYDKNLDYTPLAEPILNKCKSLILLGQTSQKIEDAVKSKIDYIPNKLKIYNCNTLEEVVKLANEIAVRGDIVLFSPASASFDMFKNFADRGLQFKKLVNDIVK